MGARRLPRCGAPGLSLGLALLVASGCAGDSPSGGEAAALVRLDPTRSFQTIHGWEATAEVQPHAGFEAFPRYADELFDRAVNELGLDRIRLEIRAGAESRTDHWSRLQSGEIDRREWRRLRYATQNDDDDPRRLDAAGFQFAELDHGVDTIVLPLKKRVEANGEHLFVNLSYVAFTDQIGGGVAYVHGDPEEYAEFVLAAFLHLKERYGWVPDAVEVILEPDHGRVWSGRLIGRAIVATARRLAEHGLEPEFIAPSTKCTNAAVGFTSEILGVPGAAELLSELSYHRYCGVSERALTRIALLGREHGLRTAMLEHIGSGHESLHQDLKLANASAWQQYTLSFPDRGDDGGAYFPVNARDPENPVIALGARARYLPQYFRFVRRGAVRIGAESDDGAFDPLAFVHPSRGATVVVKASRGGRLAIRGLPPGVYAVSYTTARERAVAGPPRRVEAGGDLPLSLPEAGVLTVQAASGPGP